MRVRLPVLRLALGGMGCALALACGDPQAQGEGCDIPPGALAISEIMVAPDGPGEHSWIEVYNASSRDLVLNRLVVGAAGSGDLKTVEIRGAGTLASGGYFVFGAGDAPHVDHRYGGAGRAGLTLARNHGRITLSCRGEIIDEVAYGDRGALPRPVPGRSLGFDGGMAPDALLNDRGAWWCPSGSPYDGVNLGTPGARNEVCGFAACQDKDGPRDVRVPAPGDLVISEVFADPVGSDTNKEWLEIHVVADHPVDLNGIGIRAIDTQGGGATQTAKIEAGACLSVAPGSHVVVGGSQDPNVNGGVTVDVTATGLDRLNGLFFNWGQTIELWRDDVLLSRAVLPDPLPGRSLMLDGGLTHVEDAHDPRAFCVATDADGGAFDGFGSPGISNRICGVLTCRDDDGAIRRTRPPMPGDLIINEVLADARNLSNGIGEYVELYIAAAAPIDLNGISLVNWKDNASPRVGRLLSETCVTVAPEQFFLIGRAVGLEGDGAPPVDMAVTPSSYSHYKNAALTLQVRWFDAVIDAARLPRGHKGFAISLHPDRKNAIDNDNPESFCIEQTRGLFADRGSPGFDNVCGPSCLDNGVPRPVRRATPGSLVITEVAARFSDSRSCQQWFEIYAVDTVDLNGLRVEGGRYNNLLDPVACAALSAGSYAVVGARAAVDRPNPWPVGVGLAAELRCLSTAPFYTPTSATDTRSLSLWFDDEAIAQTPGYGPTVADLSFALNASDPGAVDAGDITHWCHFAQPTPGAHNVCDP